MRTIGIFNPCSFFLVCPSSFPLSIIRSALKPKKVTFIPLIHPDVSLISMQPNYERTVSVGPPALWESYYQALFIPINSSDRILFSGNLLPRATGAHFPFPDNQFSNSELPIPILHYFKSFIGMLYNQHNSSTNELLGEFRCQTMP
jgi:hypothetical protein